VVGKGAHLRRTIVDRFNVVAPGQDVGLDLEADRRRYHVDPAGIVVIPRGGRREFLWSTEEP
jgi:glucose-1-phosphate adenylyltransferase